ncbi:MAG: histidine phosphatase family protein [Patescibacteria group bacterium]
MKEGFSGFNLLGDRKRGPESEPQVETRVILEFMRHGERERHPEKEKDGGPELRLTPKGRAQAYARGEEIKAQTEVALGWGSPRIRSQETSYRVMLINEELNQDDTFEEIEQKIGEKLGGVGKKILVDSRLDFHDKGPVAEAGKKAYHEKRYMSWVIDESDQSALETGDKESSTYTRMAGNVAEIIRRYSKVANHFNRLASKTDKYKKFGNQLERYFGTHQGISESFATKAIEKVLGREKRDDFLTAVGSGFAEIEGIRIEIRNSGQEQEIVMIYKINGSEESVGLTGSLLDEIIQEREGFEKMVADVQG